MKKLIYLTIILSVFTSISVVSQTLKKDSIQINKLIRTALKSDLFSGISIISDTKTVAFISNYIDAKNKALKEIQTQKEAKKNNLPGVRYKNGDKTVVPQIVEILKRKKSEELSELFSQMELDYDGSKKTYLLEPQISELLFALIEDEKNEKRALQFLGYNGVQGALPVFEKRLLSGKSTDPDRLFFWLSRERTSDLVINYLVENYNKDRSFFINNDWSISCLDDCMENGTPQHREKILQIAYDYLQHNEPEFQKSDGYLRASFNPETNLNYFAPFFELIVKYGPVEKTIPFLEKVRSYAKTHPETAAFTESDFFTNTSLKVLDPENKKQAIFKMLDDKETFFDGLKFIQNNSETVQPEILAKAFSGFEKYNFNGPYLSQFITLLEKMTTVDFGRYTTNNVHSKILRNKLIHDFNVNTRSLDENNNYLIGLGLSSKKITAEDIENLKKQDLYVENDNSILTALQLAGLSVFTDTETGTLPVDYDNLLAQFAAISQGKINPKTYLQYHYDSNSEQTDYKFLVVCNNKCLIMTPEDGGDWYDMSAFANLLDALTAELNLSEKYNFVNTGDQYMLCIFGIPNKVKELVDEYGLSYDTPENNEK